MRTLPSIRSIPVHAADLVGSWNYPIDSHKQWHLQIKLTDWKTSPEGPHCRIMNEKGCTLGIVRADSLCRWLNIEQLMELDPHIAIQAVSIALVQDRLAQFLGATQFLAITSDQIQYSQELPFYMDIQITAPDLDIQNKSNKNVISLYVPVEMLVQQVRAQTIQAINTDIHLAPSLKNRMHADIALEIGYVTLPPRQLAALSPGCLLLMSGDYVDQGVLHAKVGPIIISISEQQEENTWMIEGIYQSQPYHTQQHKIVPLSATQNPNQNEMNIDNIPMNIKIQLAHANIKFSEITKLQPGALINIDVTQDPIVSLMCNDVQIAQGHLVELDGRLAVEISTILQVS